MGTRKADPLAASAGLGALAGLLHATTLLTAGALIHAPEVSLRAVRLGLDRTELVLGLGLGLLQGVLLGLLYGCFLRLRRRPARSGRDLPLLGAIRAGFTLGFNALAAGLGLWPLLATFPELAPERALVGLGAAVVAEAGLLAGLARLGRRHPGGVRSLLAAVGAVLLGILILGPTGAVAPPSCPLPVPHRPDGPDVVVVIWDACRADALGLHGFPGGSSPVLDRVSRRGLTFARAVAPASWTLPSHASLLTGQPAARHQAHNEHPFLGPEPLTLAELLGAAGYRTLGISSNAYVSRAFGLHRGFQEFHETWASRKNRPIQSVVGRLRALWADRNPELTDNGAAVTAKLLDRLVDEDRRPLLLLVNWMETHLPCRLPEPYSRLFTPEGRPVPADTELKLFLAYLRGAVPDHLRQRFLAKHRGGARYLDRELGRLLALLEERRPHRERLLVLLSDHGENVGESGEFGHNLTLTEPLLHVHLVLTGPGLPAGRLEGRPVSLTALAPTLAELAGVPWPGSPPAPSLLADPPELPVAELYRPDHGVDLYGKLGRTARIDWDGSAYLVRRRALYAPGWKLLRTEGEPDRLLDLGADPSGGSAVATAEAPPLGAALDAWEAAHAGAVTAGGMPELDEDTEGRLRALGYID